MDEPRFYEFGEFRLDSTERVLWHGDEMLVLPPKVFETLYALVKKNGHIVGRDELMNEVWADTFVEEGNLSVNISFLRKTLGKDFIETIPRRGYRFSENVRQMADEDELLIIREKTKSLSVSTKIEDETPPELKPAAPSIQKSRRKSLAVVLIPAIIIIAAIAFYFYNSNRQPSADSIAVLPFQNASGNSDTEYLSDGISETLINSLTELQRLKVIARSTAFRYKGKEVDPQTVGRELNVRTVLMGRVRQTGDTLNVQVDLVDTATGVQLWGAEYERKVSDVLSVKQAIAREVTEKLRLKLSGEEQQRLAKRETKNAEAYEFYLRGRYFWNKRTGDSLRKAIEEFQQAIDRDPNFALGYVGLADCYLLLELYAGVPTNETLPKARAAADRALQIDESLAEAHTSSAHIYHKLWRWAEAEEEYKRAISLNPNYPTVHHWYAIYFDIRQQFDDALREAKRAQELDPLSLVYGDEIGYLYIKKNDLVSAIKELRRVIELDSGFPEAHQDLGFAYLKQQRYEEATAEFQKAVEVSGRASRYLSNLGYCYAFTGKRAEALRILKELQEKYVGRESTGMYIAGIYAGLGDKEQAFAWLDKDYQQHSGELTKLTTWFAFDNLRDDPRFIELEQRLFQSKN